MLLKKNLQEKLLDSSYFLKAAASKAPVGNGKKSN
jgi:hypothetical protein